MDYNPYTSDLHRAINKSRISMVCYYDAIERQESTDIDLYQAQCHTAHEELLSTANSYLGDYNGIHTSLDPAPIAVPPLLATTQWVQGYVAKHLPKQSATHSWSSPTNLAIAVLSGVLGGLIAALLGAALLLILP